MKIKNWEAILGECVAEMEKIPEGGVDLIATDPPYGMAYVSSWRKRKHGMLEGDDSTDLANFFKEAYRVLKNNSHIYVFANEYCIGDFRNQMLAAWFTLKRMLVWVKNNHTSGDLRWDYGNQTEYVLYAMKWRRLLNWARDRNVLHFSRVNTDLHPTAKPVDLMEYLIAKSSEEGQTVLDPFAWSFTTAIACEKQNRKWICIEKESDYYDIGLARVQASNPPPTWKATHGTAGQ